MPYQVFTGCNYVTLRCIMHAERDYSQSPPLPYEDRAAQSLVFVLFRCSVSPHWRMPRTGSLEVHTCESCVWIFHDGATKRVLSFFFSYF